MSTTHRGFTLVEILVATAIFAMFMIGILNLLDTSTKISQLETELVDTQENARFAAYHIMRTARMVGGAAMPFAGTTVGGGGDTWVSGQLISNPSSSSLTIPGFGTVNVLPGSDVLTLRGFFEISPFFTDPGTVLGSSSTVNVFQYNAAGEAVNDLDAFTPAALEGRGIVFMGEGTFCVGQIAAGASITGTGSDRRLVATHEEGTELWPDLNVGAAYPPTFAVYRVGVLESYTYFVDRENVLRRARVSGASPQVEPVAINIGGLQVALGIDANDNGEIEAGEWMDNPTGPGDVIGSEVSVLRITVLGRTRMRVPEWNEPISTFQVEDGPVNLDRSAKWRRIQVAVNLRNYKF
jgi:prepilin-type N-terminal cleavage/methylation domain-containing protein